MEKHQEWNYDEFVAFTMLFAAMEDDDLAKQEIKIIKEKIGKERYKEFKNILEENIAFENIDIIIDLKQKYLKSDEDLENFLVQIDKLIEADGSVNKDEIELINSISYILKNN